MVQLCFFCCTVFGSDIRYVPVIMLGSKKVLNHQYSLPPLTLLWPGDCRFTRSTSVSTRVSARQIGHAQFPQCCQGQVYISDVQLDVHSLISSLSSFLLLLLPLLLKHCAGLAGPYIPFLWCIAGEEFHRLDIVLGCLGGQHNNPIICPVGALG